MSISTSTPSATSGNEGTIKLAGNIAGTSAAPTVTSLTGKAVAVANLANGTAGNLLTWDAAGVAAVVATGTAAQVLTSNGAGAAPTFQAGGAGGSGQTLVTKIVAASGGDYTTLGAAIAAASSGWTIWVRAGTYTEGAITSSVTNLTIIGENEATTVLDFSSHNFTMTGNYLVLNKLNFTFTTGIMDVEADYSKMYSCNYSKSGAGMTKFFSDYGVISNSYFYENATGNEFKLWFGGQNQGALFTITNNKFVSNPTGEAPGTILVSGICSNNLFSQSGTGNKVMVGVSNPDSVFVGNLIRMNAYNAAAQGLSLTGAQSTVVGNVFMGATGYSQVGIVSSGANDLISGNSFYRVDGKAIQHSGIAGTINGNNMYTSTTTGTGIEVTAGDDTLVSDNTIRGFTKGIEIIDSTSDRVSIQNNKFASNTTNIIDAGTVTTISNNSGVPATQEKINLLMKNTSGGSIAAGNLVTLKAVAAGDEVTMVSTTAGDNKIFGIAAEAIADTAYGYIQVTGKTVLMKVNGTTDIAIGDYISHFTTAGIGQKAAAGHTAIAVALEAYTTDNSSGVIDALIISPRLI